MELLKYTIIEKTKDGLKPSLHEATFKHKGRIYTATLVGSRKEDLIIKPTASDEIFAAIAEEMIFDWNQKQKILAGINNQVKRTCGITLNELKKKTFS